jgi:hypothetical protein
MKTPKPKTLPKPAVVKKPPQPVRDGASGEFFKQANVPPAAIHHPYSGGRRIR